MHAYMLVQLLKYLLEGLAVAIAAYLISGTKKSGMKGVEILGLGLTAAATFAILDVFAPSVGVSARQGTGFGLGAQQVSWPMGMGEGFEGEVKEVAAEEAAEETAEEATTEGFKAAEEYEEGFYNQEEEPETFGSYHAKF